jgi:hypothetical protein
MNPEKLSEDQNAKLETLNQSNLAPVKTYQMHLAFQDAYQLTTVDHAKSRLKACFRWVRLGSKRLGALFTEMEKFAASLEKPMVGILTHWNHRITNAFMKG